MHAKHSRPGEKPGAQGQGHGKGPLAGRELSGGWETGLALVVPALMSWKQAETAQHVKASKGKALPMPAGQERTEQGENETRPPLYTLNSQAGGWDFQEKGLGRSGQIS